MTDTKPWELLITDEHGGTRRVTLDGVAYLIGRSDDADIQLDRPTVSRQHAQLMRNPEGRWSIQDKGSRGGTAVDRQQITQPALLSHGSRIDISRFTLRLIDPARGEHAPSTPPISQVTWDGHATDADISVLTNIAPPRLEMSHITAINDFGRVLSEMDNPDERIAALCDTLCGPVVRARWAMAIELDAEDTSRPPTQLGLSPATAADQSLHLSRTAIRAMQSANAPVLANNFKDSPAAGEVEMSFLSDAPAAAVVACPLGESQQHRLVYVNLPPMFGRTEWLALIALAVKQYEQAEANWAAREAARAKAVIERDMENAQSIQASILPSAFEDARLNVAWSYHPCDAVGGDLIDVVTMPNDHVLLVIADVTGHGLQAALTTLSVHSIIHTCVRTGIPVTQIMPLLNDQLCDDLPVGRFVTMLCLDIDLNNGDVLCLNAGHHPPLIRKVDGSFRALPGAEQFPLGIAPVDYTLFQDTLAPGELLALTTDGLTELVTDNGGMLGDPGVRQLIADATPEASGDLQAHAEQIRDAMDRIRKDLKPLDDETFLLAMRIAT